LRSEATLTTPASGAARAALPWSRRHADQRLTFADRLLAGTDVDGAVRELCASHGGGAFLGLAGGQGVFASREHAVLVLGAPRSGKTSAVVIPSVLACPGALVSTSTKTDVRDATVRSRAGLGEVWAFDPTGEADACSHARELRWSPVAAASSWDESLHTARAMTLAAPAVGRGTQHEQHWAERAAALLAPLLLAAHQSKRGINEVLGWVLRHELKQPGEILDEAGAQVACDVLLGVARTDQRERSSIFSATAGVLALYNTDSARRAAANPNFDPAQFAASTDTIYITAPAHRQALCAPLVAGLLEQIRHATYRRAATHPTADPLFFCLDEVANIAPIHDLPALVSEAGGQGLHVMACLQDLSQARARWGEGVAEGFLTLFQSKLVLPGISDPRTLEALSLVLGEIDRPMPTHSTGFSTSTTGWLSPTTRTHSRSDGYTVARQRRMPPGEIAAVSPGNALLVTGARHRRLRLTPYHVAEPWRTITHAGLACPAGHATVTSTP
jgi:type IV secretory pathway TraG/TraD family ATPase VirD4